MMKIRKSKTTLRIILTLLFNTTAITNPYETGELTIIIYFVLIETLKEITIYI